MNSSLKERFARLGPIQAINRPSSGSAAAFALRPADGLATIQTVTAAMTLAQRGIPMLRAKRAIEEVLERGSTVLGLPTVEDSDAVVRDLAASGIAATPAGPPDEVDIRAVRKRQGLTQEQFARRYGLDRAALRNWEQGRTRPEAAVRSYVRVIERRPEQVEEALAVQQERGAPVPSFAPPPADVVAYVDEAGEKGLSSRLTSDKDARIGLFCSLAFPVERLDEMRARFVPGYNRFIAAMPPNAKPHIADAFKPRNEAWGAVAREVREEFFTAIRDLEIPVVYEARRLRVDRGTYEMQRAWFDKLKTTSRAPGRPSERWKDKRVEEALMLGMALKLDALCADAERRRIDVLFDETDLAKVYQRAMDKPKSISRKEAVSRKFDPETQTLIERKVEIRTKVLGASFSLDAQHLGELRVAGKDDPLVLATDITANALLRHLQRLPPTAYLNHPESVSAWVLEDRVYGARDGAVEDLL